MSLKEACVDIDSHKRGSKYADSSEKFNNKAKFNNTSGNRNPNPSISFWVSNANVTSGCEIPRDFSCRIPYRVN